MHWPTAHRVSAFPKSDIGSLQSAGTAISTRVMIHAVKRAVLGAIQAVGTPVATLFDGDARRAGLRAPTTRAAFVAGVPLGSALEIGPFDNPTIAGAGVAYFDVLDAAALRARAARIGYGGDRIPARIDFVSPVGDLSVIDRRFDAVLSSHAIEHQPDLIAHLQGVERILAPGGAYYLIVPDRRYTFDHFLAETGFDEVARAHEEGRRVHTRQAILDHRLGTTHNNPLRHWLGIHGRPAPTERMRASAEAEIARAEQGEYIDVHAWAFSPHGFAALVKRLRAQGYIGLEVERVHATRFADLEFFSVLRSPR